MAVTNATDRFANIHLQDVSMTVADTIAFEEVSIGLNLFDKVGLIIHRLEVFWSSTAISTCIGDGDIAWAAMTSSNTITGLESNERGVIMKVERQAALEGTAGNFEATHYPQVLDYCGLPGGGLLVPPKPLYLAVDSASLGTAISAYFRIIFTILSLKDADYFELLQTYRFFG